MSFGALPLPVYATIADNNTVAAVCTGTAGRRIMTIARFPAAVTVIPATVSRLPGAVTGFPEGAGRRRKTIPGSVRNGPATRKNKRELFCNYHSLHYLCIV